MRKWSGDPSEVHKWSGDPSEGKEVVGRPSVRCGSESGDPPGGAEVVGRPSVSCGSGRETLREVHRWSGDHTGGPVVVG